jgi:excinuclease ABC subunit A
MPEGSRLLVLAPMVRERKGTYQALFKEITKSGFTRVRVNGDVRSLDEEIELDRYKSHTIEAVVDRLVIQEPENEEDRLNMVARLTDSVETALRVGEGYVTVQNLSANPPEDRQYSENLACPEHGSILVEIEPRTFSFNTPHGACPVCQGLGFREEIDPNLVIPDKSLSLKQGAIRNSEWDPKDVGGYLWQMLETLADNYHFSLDTPFEKLSKEQQKLILYGTNGKEITVRYVGRNGRRGTFRTAYEGVVGNMQRRYQETQSDWIRNKLGAYITRTPCPECGGKRLRKEALGVTVDDKNIIEVTQFPVDQL